MPTVQPPIALDESHADIDFYCCPVKLLHGKLIRVEDMPLVGEFIT